MSRDEYLNAMPRELGAAYYRTLHGEGAASDVARAVDAITEAQVRLGLAAEPGRSSASGEAASRPPGWRRPRWRIRDAMTTHIAAADRSMTCKQVVRLMIGRRVNAVPVVDSSHKVLGMVSEADILRRQEGNPRRPGIARYGAVLLARGESVIIDASFITARQRATAAAAADAADADLVQLRCTAPGELAAQRMRARPSRVSDGDEAIAAKMGAVAEPWPEAAVIDTEAGGTAGAAGESVDRALEAIRPHGPEHVWRPGRAPAAPGR